MNELLEELVKEAEKSHSNRVMKDRAYAMGVAEKAKCFYNAFTLEGFSRRQAFELTKIVLRKGNLERSKNHNPSNPGYEKEPSADRNG